MLSDQHVLIVNKQSKKYYIGKKDITSETKLLNSKIKGVLEDDIFQLIFESYSNKHKKELLHNCKYNISLAVFGDLYRVSIEREAYLLFVEYKQALKYYEEVIDYYKRAT